MLTLEQVITIALKVPEVRDAVVREFKLDNPELADIALEAAPGEILKVIRDEGNPEAERVILALANAIYAAGQDAGAEETQRELRG